MTLDVQTKFHQEWLGLAQPYEGLVFSVPVLADAQIAPSVTADLTIRYRNALLRDDDEAPGRYGALPEFFANFLGYERPGALVLRAALPEDVRFYSLEAHQEIRPSFAIARVLPKDESDLFAGFGAPTTPASGDESGEASDDGPYAALVWDLRDDGAPDGLDLDRPEEVTGPWRLSPTAKFERLLRTTGVPVGLLGNGRDLRLVYAPAGETTSHLTFRGEFLERPEGRPILAAFELLLHADRAYGAARAHTLEGLLRESRRRQADVTKELASQVFEAVELLLAGFENAARRDGASGRDDWLRAALEEPRDHAYQGLLSVVLRLVFLLYAEDQSLLPTRSVFYARHLSVKGLYEELLDDAGQHPESMNNRFGAYGRLLALFRAVFLGVEHGDFRLPPRRGKLFDPNAFPFLEGGMPGTTAAIQVAEERAATRVPSVDDGTIFEVLHRLVFFQGQRLSYASLDVEQLGSVYESLMGYHVLRLAGEAVRLGPSRVWVEVEALRRATPLERKKLLKEDVRLSTAQQSKVDALLAREKNPAALAVALNELSPDRKSDRPKHLASPGRLVLQPGEERRRSGSHYTPRSLTEGIVRKTLEPLLACLGESPTEESLLALKICDPAMGSGAFLVEVVRQLGAKIVEAWTRSGKLAEVAEKLADPELAARRLVTQRCIYGVDKNPAAVELAKLSLWLVTLSADLPFTFVDHSLRHGDSLVGLDLEQLACFHWTKEAQLPTIRAVLEDSLEEALDHRARLLELAKDDSPRSLEERRRLLDHAEHATEKVRMVADLCVGAFFDGAKERERTAERVRRLDLVRLWLGGDLSVEPELKALAAKAREELSPFHWPLEFPEVFYLERPDPLDGMKVNGAAMVEAFVGNPPFAGKNGISESGGPNYLNWLQTVHEGAHGNADLSAHFFRRAATLLGAHGAIGLIATNTIGQGDTRATGLQHLVRSGFSIYGATVNMPWPGDAAVTVSVAHLAKGRPGNEVGFELDGRKVEAISSRLRAKPERPDPRPLNSNASLSFQGSIVLGMGFTLTPEERDVLIAKNPKNAERIFPYLGGEEVNTSPTQSFERYVISFGAMELEEAEKWPDLLSIVREKVKPERDKNNRENYRDRWWQFGEYRPGLFAAIAPLSRCFVASVVSKHQCYARLEPNATFSGNLHVFAFEGHSPFAVLQSRVHESWVLLMASSLETRVKYVVGDCFETFPFPAEDPRAILPELEELGEKLYAARAAYMVGENVGLTKTYNALKDPNVSDPRILELRRLHEDLDRAVLRSYPKLPGVGSSDPSVVGWSDVEVPPFCVATDEEKAALARFEDEVIDRLFVLNAERAEKEARLGQTAKKGGAKKTPTSSSKAPEGAAPSPVAAGGAKRGRGKKKGDPEGDGGQGSLF